MTKIHNMDNNINNVISTHSQFDLSEKCEQITQENIFTILNNYIKLNRKEMQIIVKRSSSEQSGLYLKTWKKN